MYVSQATNLNYCWASRVACVGNFLKSKSYTGEYVAQYVCGINYDQSATPVQALAALKDIYGVSYTYYSTVPSDNTILNSISSLGRPLYSRWSSSAGSHVTVISGINVIAGYITIMNPASGFMSASANGSSYTYISVNSGNTFIFNLSTELDIKFSYYDGLYLLNNGNAYHINSTKFEDFWNLNYEDKIPQIN